MPPSVAPCECPQNASVPILISACVGDCAAARSKPVAKRTSDIWSAAPCSGLPRAAAGLAKL